MIQSVRILDLSRVLAGPIAAMTLGDLGANVIKVERPGTGDESRGWGPPFNSEGESAYYLSANRNKLSVALDFDLPADRNHLFGLIAEADVVLENYLPGALQRRGISHEELLRQHPRLIWCTISGFGADSLRPGYDFVVQAESGWMSITGDPKGEPVKTGVALADVIAGKDAAISILAALVRRELEGEVESSERRIVISLLNSARAALINVAQNTLVSGNPPRRWGNAHANLVPYDLFHAADRDIVIAVGNDQQWQSCCRALGLTELGADARLATNSGRLAARGDVIAAISSHVKSATAAHWIAQLEREGVPCGVVKSVVDSIEGTNASALTGMPPSVPGNVRLRPPRLDEHGELIRRHGWEAFRLA